MCAGRICLVPAVNDLAVGPMRDFGATKRSNILVNIVCPQCLNNRYTVCTNLDCLTKKPDMGFKKEIFNKK